MKGWEDLVTLRIFFQLLMLESFWFFVCFLLTPLHTSGSHCTLWELLFWETEGSPVPASPAKAGEPGWDEAKEGCGEMLWKSRWAVQVHRRDQGHSLKDSQMVELDWWLFPSTPFLWRTSVLTACSKGQSSSYVCWPLVHTPLHN